MSSTHNPDRRTGNEPRAGWIRRFWSWCLRLGWAWWLELTVVLVLSYFVSIWLEKTDNWIELRYEAYHWLQQQGLSPRNLPAKTAVLIIDDREYWTAGKCSDAQGKLNPKSCYPQGRAPIPRDYLAYLVTELTTLQHPPQAIALDFDLRAEHPEQIHDQDTAGKYQPPDRALETATLVRALREARKRGTTIIVSKSVWKQNGYYTEEEDVYNDPVNCGGGKKLAGHTDCILTSNEPNLMTHKDAQIVPGFIALPHQTWHLPFPLRTAEHPGPDTDHLLRPFSWQIASVFGFSEPEVDEAVPFAPYLEVSDWVGMDGKAKLLNGEDYGDKNICELANASTCRTMLASFSRTHKAATEQLFSSAIVLIGGDWHTRAYGRGDFADRYATPVGTIPGIFIHANYAEAFSRGQALKIAKQRLLTLFDVLLAIGLALLLKRAEQYPRDRAVARFGMAALRFLILVGFVGLSVFAGYLAVRASYFFDPVIIALGLVAHYAYDAVEWPWRAPEHHEHVTVVRAIEQNVTVVMAQGVPTAEGVSTHQSGNIAEMSPEAVPGSSTERKLKTGTHDSKNAANA